MALTTAQLVANISVTGASEAKSTLQDVGSSVDKTGSILKSGLGAAVGLAAGVAGAAISTLGGVLQDSINIAMKHQAVMSQTAQVLKSTKDASGETAKSISDMSEALSKTTMFSQDSIQAGQNLLLTFTGIGQKVFPETTQAMLDLSQATGQSLSSSAMQLGKALNDPLKGMSALQRVGVSFSATEQEQIKTMMAHNDVMGAQKVMLKELESEFGGSAQAAGKTFAGQMAILQHTFEDMEQKIGTALLPILGTFVGFINQNIVPVLSTLTDWFVQRVAPALQMFASWLTNQVSLALKNFWAWVQQYIMPALTLFYNWIIQYIIPVLSKMWQWVEQNVNMAWQNMWKWINQYIIPVFQQLWRWLEQSVNPSLQNLWKWINQNVVPVLQQMWQWTQNYVNQSLQIMAQWLQQYVIPALQQMWQWINQNVVPVLQQMWTWIQQNVVPALGNLHDWIENRVVPALQDAEKWIGDHVTKALQVLWGWINSNIMPILNNLSQFIENNIVPALRNFETWIKDHVQTALQNLWGWINTNIVPKLNELGAVINTQVVPRLQQFWSWLTGYLIPQLQEVWKQIVGFVSPSLSDLGKAFGKTGDDTGKLVDSFNKLMNTLNSLNPQTKGTGDQFNLLGSIIQSFVDQVKVEFAIFVGTITFALLGINYTIQQFEEGLTSTMDNIRGLIENAKKTWQDFNKFVMDLWNQNIGALPDDLNKLGADLIGIWNNLWGTIEGIAQMYMAPITGIGQALVDTLKDLWQGLSNDLVGHSIIPDMMNMIVQQFTNLPGRVMGAISGLPGQISGLWSQINSIFTNGENSVQNFIGSIAKNIDNVASALGAGKPIPGYASGTPYGGHPGGAMIVGESGPELMIAPAGTHVLSNSATKGMLGGVPGYANGTPGSADIMSLITQGASGIINNIFSSLHLSLPGGLSSIATAAADDIKKWALAYIQKILPSFSSGGGGGGSFTSQMVNIPGNVVSWIQSAIGLTGVPASWLSALVTIAMHESGGNPSAVNNWDINAAEGHPSEGLMQTIGPTFAANMVAGHGDILNPIDNAAAAINYIKSRYGSVFNVPGIMSMTSGGPYVGYADGTDYASGGLSWVGERGRELMYIPRGAQIVPHSQIGATQQPVNVTVQPASVVLDGRTLANALMPYITDAIRYNVGTHNY